MQKDIQFSIIPLAVFTFKYCLIMLTFSEIFSNNFCDMHEHAIPISNRAVIVSILRSLNAKFDHFNFAHSGLDMVWFFS